MRPKARTQGGKVWAINLESHWGGKEWTNELAVPVQWEKWASVSFHGRSWKARKIFPSQGQSPTAGQSWAIPGAVLGGLFNSLHHRLLVFLKLRQPGLLQANPTAHPAHFRCHKVRGCCVFMPWDGKFNFRGISYFMSSGLLWTSRSLAMTGSWPAVYRVNSKIPAGLGKKMRWRWIKLQLLEDNFELKL